MSKAVGSRERSFVVTTRATSLPTVVELLAPGDVFALQEGRVFVDGRRVDVSAPLLEPGSRVTWYTARSVRRGQDEPKFRVLDRRDDILIVAKPADWSSEPERSGHRLSLREHLSECLATPNVHIATRLDAGVGGLVMVAIGRDACRYCSELQGMGQVEKSYFAIALGAVAQHSHYATPISRNQRSLTIAHRLAESNAIRFSGALSAPVSLLRVDAVTGRRHQIRLHTSGAGHPLLGDRRYQGPSQWVRSDGTVQAIVRPMLHAWRLRIPWKGEAWTTVCPAPSDMRHLWADFGCDWPEF